MLYNYLSELRLSCTIFGKHWLSRRMSGSALQVYALGCGQFVGWGPQCEGEREVAMPISFVDAYDLDRDSFEATGAFDPILDVDSKLFIDPALLPESACPEFQGARDEVERYFSGLIALLRHSKSPGDRFWKKASKLLSFTEIRGTCLGYSERGTAGNAIGPRLREGILASIKGLEEAGPIIFELIGVFEEGVGCDRISDLLTYKLIDRICAYTERVMRECSYSGPVRAYRGFQLPASPCSNDVVLLLPRDILHPLPLAKRFEDIEAVCRENERVRDNVNEWFDFSEGAKPSKRDMYRHMRDDAEFRDAFVDAYREAEAEQYDFGVDSVGEVAWYENGKRFVERNPSADGDPLQGGPGIGRVCHR